MKINFDQPIVDIDGETEVADLRKTVTDLLYKVRISQDADQQDSQCELADKIKAGGNEVKAEDVVTIKQCVSSGISTPFVARQIRRLLEGETEG